jgi:hypothetical protein
MSSKYHKLDFEKVKTYSIKDRYSKVSLKDFAKPLRSQKTLPAFLESLPNILMGKEFREFCTHYRQALKQQKPAIWMMGAHVIKCGLNLVIIDLLQKEYITHLALNGACAIHDIELAMWGQTSEDVAQGLQDGTFGMARETAEFINQALSENSDNKKGYGELLGQELIRREAPNLAFSLLANAYKLNIPISLHSAFGTEITHQHPGLDAAAYGKKSQIDFQILTHSLTQISKESVILNIGSAVILPEVFLKSLTVVRNLNYPAYGFYTAVFDMIKHYRPTVNVMQRPTEKGGKGYYFIGHHELMIPLLAASIQS